jgi:hypothetical protein
MALAGDKYYIQGFGLDAATKTSVQIVQSLFENSITVGPKVIITYKAGAKTSDFASMLPPGVTIEDGDRYLNHFRVTKLIPKIIKLNSTEIEVYDLEDRVLNYLVTYDRQSALIEVRKLTAMVIFHLDVTNEVELRKVVDNSLYFKFRTVPVGEYYSFPMVNTSSSDLVTLSQTNVPIYISKYTPYKMEYSKVLLGFYDELKARLPDFNIYLGQDRLQDTTIMDSNRISITLDSLDNLSRRPYMGDPNIIDSIATLNLKVETNDQLKYNFIKNAYQNLNLISDLARFTVLDTKGESWMTHVEWQPAKDDIRMTEIRDDHGRFAFVLNLNCELYFYVVKDAMYNIILFIDQRYETFSDKAAKFLIT